MVLKFLTNCSQTTTGITEALTSHNFCTCNLKSWYLVIFSGSFTLMFWFPGTTMSMISHSLFSLSVTTISGLRCSISLSVWIAKSQSILHLSFSSTGSGVVVVIIIIILLLLKVDKNRKNFRKIFTCVQRYQDLICQLKSTNLRKKIYKLTKIQFIFVLILLYSLIIN